MHLEPQSAAEQRTMSFPQHPRTTTVNEVRAHFVLSVHLEEQNTTKQKIQMRFFQGTIPWRSRTLEQLHENPRKKESRRKRPQSSLPPVRRPGTSQRAVPGVPEGFRNCIANLGAAQWPNSCHNTVTGIRRDLGRGQTCNTITREPQHSSAARPGTVVRLRFTLRWLAAAPSQL